MVAGAEHTFLDGGLPLGIGEDALGVDPQALSNSHGLTFGIVADRGGQARLGFQSREHGDHVAGPAEPVFPFFNPNHRDRRLGADPLHVAPDVPVEHHVAQDQDSWANRLLEQGDQRVRRP